MLHRKKFKYILPAEFHKMLQEMRKYHNLKEDSQIQDKAKLKEITKGQREKFYQKSKNSEKPFLKKCAGGSSI